MAKQGEPQVVGRPVVSVEVKKVSLRIIGMPWRGLRRRLVERSASRVDAVWTRRDSGAIEMRALRWRPS